MSKSINIAHINAIAIKAGEKIMEIYNSHEFLPGIDYKADNSPLTIADKEAHQVIASQLSQYYPEIPVLSEEGKHIEYSVRKDWDLFWLVDPLDGTKEFIKRNGEFTVNIALIKNGKTITGVIYAPVFKTIYYATQEDGAYKQVLGEEATPLKVNNKHQNLIAVRSRSHGDPAEDELLGKYSVTDQVAIGSSLKFCLIAEGKADIYYRHGPTMEWDTAAGQAILEIAGGSVTSLDGKTTPYNKPSLLNGSFLCRG